MVCMSSTYTRSVVLSSSYRSRISTLSRRMSTQVQLMYNESMLNDEQKLEIIKLAVDGNIDRILSMSSSIVREKAEQRAKRDLEIHGSNILSKEEISLLDSGERARAIISFRSRTGESLSYAKRIIDTIDDSRKEAERLS